MSVLEDFWYGNIEPSEYDTSSAKEYKEALLRISRNEESLQDTLTDAQRKLFAQYLDSVREFQAMAEFATRPLSGLYKVLTTYVRLNSWLHTDLN